MRLRILGLLAVLCSCESATAPIIPVSGDYTLVAASTLAGPRYAGGAWRNLPFEYDVSTVCRFRLTGGSLQVAGRGYTIDLRQETVSCEDGTQPAGHEAGTLSEVLDSSSGAPSGTVAFETSGSPGWVSFGKYSGGGILHVELAPPQGGAITYLEFQRVP